MNYFKNKVQLKDGTWKHDGVPETSSEINKRCDAELLRLFLGANCGINYSSNKTCCGRDMIESAFNKDSYFCARCKNSVFFKNTGE